MFSIRNTVIVATLLAAMATIGAMDAFGQIATGKPGAKVPIEIYYLQWLQNDIIRNVEEIRRAKDPWERRDLVEDIEDIIHDRIEFPMIYDKADPVEMSNMNRIGAGSDVKNAKDANPAAQEMAVAYALLGIAKGYEGFGVAATDYFDKAQEIFPRVMDIEVELDHNQDRRRLAEWISKARGYWGNMDAATRITFYGKRVSQEVIDSLNMDELTITSNKPRVSQYTLFVAKRDFVRGLKTYLQTDDELKEYRPNKFSIYLEPGEYRIKTDVSSVYDIRLKVSRNYNENNFILETLQSGIALYPIPDITVFEDEMKKAMMKARQRDEDADAAGDLEADLGGLEESADINTDLNEDIDFPLE